ncbi:hypothetical protein N7463_010937 [Penicillium fimorum]|uniref:Prion-inhibition and propagation HeLo domain-containing protein n=1 Tax=Penicillium fimorum TaxID=1882269 RepID=A0A9W9XLN0_9EURO|nr:hypothetical protein N7463_010937 [Penicillium fimorum]
MEPVGLAVGILGLAGLFNTCLDVLEKFGSWKDFGSESRSLAAQFKVHKLRLEKWGQAVGFEQGNLLDEHDKLLDDPRTFCVVQDLLSAIRDICGCDDDTSPMTRSGADTQPSKRQLFNSYSHPHTSLESKRQKLGWALRDKAKRLAQVEQFSVLVENLHNLIPTYGDRGAVLRYEVSTSHDGSSRWPDDNLMGQGAWAKEFSRILSRIESEIEGNHPPDELYEIYVERRIERTCEWVLNRPWFQDWSSSDFPPGCAKRLWIHGPAGFGKSILCARIIQHLSSLPETPVVHFFLSSDFKSTGDLFMVIRSWLSQMMSHPIAFALVREAWIAQQGQRARREDVINLLREIGIAIPGCTFILDGLDECSWFRGNENSGGSDSIASFMNALRQATIGTAARIMIVSRDEPEIRTCLSDDTNGAPFSEHKITPKDVRCDVESYSRSIVQKRLSKKTEIEKEDISQKLAERCNGQFLWIKMQQDSLRSWKNQKQLEQAINATPIGVDHIYERNWIKMSQLSEEGRDRAFSLLRWTAFALRPLTVSELTEALLISEHRNELRLEELPDTIDVEYIDCEISHYCGSLLEFRRPQAECSAGLWTVHLAHFSVKQYLLYNIPAQGRTLQLNGALGSFTEATENTLLAKMCLRYVSCPSVWVDNVRVKHEQVLGSFLDYALSSWQQHTSFANISDSEVVELVNQLFDTRRPNWTLWKEWFDLNVEEGGDQSMIGGNSVGPLYYAAWLGLADTVNFLIHDRKHDTNEKGNLGRTPLVAACGKGNLRVAEILLHHGADVSIMGNDRLSPVYLAARDGHFEILKLLLERGADTTLTSKGGTTPVNLASRNGHLEVVKLLLESGADITVGNKSGTTPVNMASHNGHLEVVKLLLENGADITVVNSNGMTPLYAASLNGHLEVVRLLLAKGADITVTHKNGWTPVNIASSNGHLEIVKLLLEKGADITVANTNGWMPVNAASHNGHLEVVKLLLESGADITVVNSDKITPLYAASLNGHLEVVRLLLTKDADITLAHKNGWTPINTASSKGHLEVVKLLLEKGADIHIANNNGWTPVNIASSNGHLEVVKLLLESGADITVVNSDGMTPLYAASLNGHLEVVRLLLTKDADITLAHKNGWTPINTASSKGHLEVVKLLLEKGADIHIANNNGWTPVNIASSNGHLEVVKLLLESGADITVVNSDGMTPLYAASLNGHLEVVRLLLTKGADITVANTNGWMPVNAASHNGHLEVVKLLLESGADITVVNSDKITPLYAASLNGHLEVVRLLLTKDADITLAHKNGWTPINTASSKGHLEVVKLLLENGADITVANSDKITPLYAASLNGHLEVVRLLLAKGADITVTHKNGWTPVNIASSNGHLEIVKLLLEKGADITVANTNGWMPVNAASYNGHLELVKLLVKKGADIKVTNNSGWMPVNAASYSGHLEIVKFLCDHGASVEAEDLIGRTSLFLASARGHTEVVQELLSRGAMADTKDWYRSTPLFAAVRNGHEMAVSCLLDLQGACVQFEDGFGHTLLSWARKSGNTEVIEAVVKFAQMRGINVCEGDLAVKASSMATGGSTSWCDVCTRHLSAGGDYHACSNCLGGGFAVCSECFEIGARCLDGSHELALRKPTVP